MAVVFGVDDCGCFSSKPSKILTDGETPDVDAGIEERFERDRGGELSGSDQVTRELIDLLMDWLEEVRRLEKIRNAVKSFVVDQNSAQQRLFRLDVVRSGTEERGRFFGLLAGCRISECHGCRCLPGNCGIARALWPQRADVAVVPQFTSCIERWERLVCP